MTNYWKSFLKDVLWKTLKAAVLYAVLMGIVFFLLAILVVLTAMPAAHSGIRKTFEAILLFAIYGVAGAAGGFLFGIATLHRHVERIAEAAYQTVRAMITTSAERIGDGAQAISTEHLRRYMETDIGVRLAAFSKEFGAARKLYAWIVRKPVQLIQRAILRDFLPSIKEATIPMSALDEFLKKRVVQGVRLPIEAKLKTLQYVSVGVGIVALALPLILIRLG